MKKRIASLLLATGMLLTLLPTAFAAEGGYVDSGFSTISKLTKSEVARLLEANPATASRDVFLEEPRFTAPYYPGIVRDDALQAALDRLNAMRRLAGVPAVELGDCMSAQHATVLNAVSDGIYHGNSRPEDMDPDFFYIANTATLYANLVGGHSLTNAVDAFMNDLGAHNLERQGHRRDMLGPVSLSASFGYSYKKDSPAGSYVALMIGGNGNISQAEAPTEYDFIAWPSSGNFPNSVFSHSAAWTVSVNPLYYADPDINTVAVTLTRESDSKAWRFSGSGYSANTTGDYFNVDSAGTKYSTPSAIIFRPTLSEKTYEGVYTVEITGLKDKSGKSAEIKYQVNFFYPDTVDSPSFKDVSKSDWFYDAVEYANEKGLMNGTGGNNFSPNATTTRGMITTILARMDGVDTSGGSVWYEKGTQWAVANGISDGTNPGGEITREQLATMLYRYAGSPEVSGSMSAYPDNTSVSGWAADAMMWAVSSGIINGVDGRLAPQGTATRAMAATMLMRFCERAA